MIDIYGLLAISMAALIKTSLRWPLSLKVCFFVLAFGLFTIGIHNTNKYIHHSFHDDSNTKESFWDEYLKLRSGPQHFSKYKQPDISSAMKGRDEYINSGHFHIKTDHRGL